MAQSQDHGSPVSCAGPIALDRFRLHQTVPREPIDRRHAGAIARAAAQPFGDMELVAGRVITRRLHALVTVQDDGTADSMPDLRLDYPDGRLAYGEVVADADRAYVQTMAELKKRQGGSFPFELAAPELGRVWFVTVDVSRIDQLVPALATTLRGLQQRGRLFERVSTLGARERISDSDLSLLASLGVVQLASRAVRESETGTIFVYQDGVEGRPDPDALVSWCRSRLREPDWSDVRRKLRGSGAEERHLVVILTFSTPGDVYFALTESSSQLPTTPPDLPPEVTHLWLIPQYAMGRCVAWLPGDGWVDVTYG